MSADYHLSNRFDCRAMRFSPMPPATVEMATPWTRATAVRWRSGSFENGI